MYIYSFTLSWYLALFGRKFITDLIQSIGSTRYRSTSEPKDDLNLI